MIITGDKKFNVVRGKSASRQAAHIDEFRLTPESCLTATIRRYEDAAGAVMVIELPATGLRVFKSQNLRKDARPDVWTVSKVYKQLSSPVSRWSDIDITNQNMLLVYSVTLVNGVRNVSYNISE